MMDKAETTTEQAKEKPRRTGLMDAPASAPEVRPEDVITPGREQRRDYGRKLDQQQMDMELDKGIDGSFPASDPPSIVSPKRPPQR